MRKLIFIILLISFIGCGFSENKCLEKVKIAFPNYEIILLESFHYIVKNNNNEFWYVKNMGCFTANITYLKKIDLITQHAPDLKPPPAESNS